METVEDYLSARFAEVESFDFYREIFPNGELDERGAMTKGKYCGIAVEVSGSGKDTKVKRYTICNDLEPIGKLNDSGNFVIISPCSYAGKTQKQEFAHALYAIAIDLDGLFVWDDLNGEMGGLINLFQWIEVLKEIPLPTYICATADRNAHLYYVLDEPLRLYPDVLDSLRIFRASLIGRIWNSYITEEWKNPQLEISPTQSFRAVGCVRKDGKGIVRAFKTGERTSVSYLNSFFKEDKHIRPQKKNLTLEQAKALYPAWYQARIVEGKSAASKGAWHFSRAVYDSFKQRIIDGENKSGDESKGAVDGTRFHCICQLATTAIQCGISQEELERDAYELQPILDARTRKPNNRFTVDDVATALEMFNDNYSKVRRETKEFKTGLILPPQKRNWRKQEKHLKLARAQKAVLKELGEIKDGRPSKEQFVYAYVRLHPEAKPKEIAENTGVSLSTVYRHLKKFDENKNTD